jgi:DNA/RNA-binding domain of Phe-tRNA-synthetase-like protein
MATGAFRPPFSLRSGTAGESYESLRGPFRLEGKPLLCDADGPLDTPITGNERVKVTSDTVRALLVAYMPSETLEPSAAKEALERLVRAAPVVHVVQTWGT